MAFALWFVLCSSDGVDGYLARRHGTTTLGAFLDPLADKVLVLGAMFTLVASDVFWVVPVVIIAARELAISLYRTFVGAKGVSVPASRIAKCKTFTQQLAVGFAIVPLTALDAKWLWNGLLWISVVLALISGSQYMWRAHVGERLDELDSGLLTMRCDVVAVGTELLLGQIIDTNSAHWIGEQLAANGIDSLLQVKVGDNLGRMESRCCAPRSADADAVIVCGGLGPTHDDLTREAIAAVMGVELVHDESVADVIRDLFASRGRTMAENNLRQALVPVGAHDHPADPGDGAGLDLPGHGRRRRQGHLRRAGRAARDERHARAGACCPTCAAAAATPP